MRREVDQAGAGMAPSTLYDPNWPRSIRCLLKPLPVGLARLRANRFEPWPSEPWQWIGAAERIGLLTAVIAALSARHPANRRSPSALRRRRLFL